MGITGQDLRISQSQRLRLTQHQVRFVRLLELNAPEFDEAVERELEANPALEESDAENSLPTDETPYYLRRAGSPGREESNTEYTHPSDQPSLYDYLREQVEHRSLPEDIAAAAEYIIGNLDTNGYLRRPLENIIDDIAFSTGVNIPQKIARQGLEVIRELDPAGVGAQNLRECLQLQLQRLPDSETVRTAGNILERYFEAFTKRHLHKIASGLRLKPAEVEAADDLIRSLNPKPGATYGGERETSAGIIVPDFIIGDENGELTVTVNNRFPELRIEEGFSKAAESLDGKRRRERKGSEFILNRYNDARDFIALMNQRQTTLMKVMKGIVRFQKEYFLTGDVYTLKPMMIRDLSEATGLDGSVISRATNNKYAAMPWGAILPLRTFFSDSKGDENTGETLTNRQMEAEIKLAVENEDKRHPLSDEKIRQVLLERGYDISRRTIAKYRDREKIPVARLRKKL